MQEQILLDNKRGWKSTKTRPKVKCFLLTSPLIEHFRQNQSPVARPELVWQVSHCMLASWPCPQIAAPIRRRRRRKARADRRNHRRGCADQLRNAAVKLRAAVSIGNPYIA